MAGERSNQAASQSSGQDLRHRAVVSNFIVKEGNTSDNEHQTLIALFRRSDKVRTYQNKLAPISGSIEPNDKSPLAAAIRELQEETQLCVPEDLTLCLRGHPFSISDPSIGRSWTVYPFSWTLNPSSESKIKTDWEHTSFEWVTPSTILSGSNENDCVPRLAESVQRTYVSSRSLILSSPSSTVHLTAEAAKHLQNAINDLKTDHTNGARVLATKAGSSIQTLACDLNLLPPTPSATDLKRWWRLLCMSADLLIENGRPSMNSAITTCVLNLLDLIPPVLSNPSTSPESKLAHIRSSLTSHLSTRAQTSTKIAQNFSSYLTALQSSLPNPSKTPLHILTLSSSSTLHSCLLHHLTSQPPNSSPIHLSILESRPNFEGASLAHSLLSSLSPQSSSRLKITVAPDSHASLLSSTAHLLVLGADRIDAHGRVSNKTGSLAAAACMRAHGKGKVVVLSESEKIAKAPPSSTAGGDEEGEERGGEEEDNGPEDVVKAYPAETRDFLSKPGEQAVKVKNVYFEWVPAEWVDAYITEHASSRDGEGGGGVWGRKQIEERSRWVGELEKKIFAELWDIDDGMRT
ncbi:MAG: hypothetical protein Q9227_001432 [Pyrenula ochraceoflavens]